MQCISSGVRHKMLLDKDFEMSLSDSLDSLKVLVMSLRDSKDLVKVLAESLLDLKLSWLNSFVSPIMLNDT